ncbi:MAG: hypothetical protein GX952_03370 [Firmicutes bacterium]|nr:hypothetical protein [Bacillota bacterium]
MERKHWLQLATLIAALALTAMLMGKTALGMGAGTEQDPLVAKSYVDQLVRLQVLELERGAILRGEAGTEIVLRAGQAAAITSPQGGISDLTAGRDVQAGEIVAKNHLLLIPRSDGRGLKALTDIVVVARGGVGVEN